MAYDTNLAIAQANNIKRTEYWDNRLLEMIKLERDNFVFTTLGREVIVPLNQGTKTISFRRYLALPVTNHKLTEGVAPTQPLQGEAIRVDASVDQFGAYMQINDWVNDIHMDDIKQIYQPELARHAAELVERNIISKIEADASVYYVGSATSMRGVSTLSTSKFLTIQDLRKVALFMKNQNRMGHTKFGGKPVAVVHPNVMADLLDDDDLKNRLLTPGQENAPIKIGSLQNYQFYGMYVQETLIAPVRGVDIKVVTAATILSGFEGANFVVGDLLAAPDIDGGRGAILKVATLSTGGAIATFTVLEGGYGYTASTNDTILTKLTGVGTGVIKAGLAVNALSAKVYATFVLGKDPYVVTKLGAGAVQFKMTGFEADKSDVLGQKATFGYKLWTGAKVVDPLAITVIYSQSAYDPAVLGAEIWDAKNPNAADLNNSDLTADQVSHS